MLYQNIREICFWQELIMIKIKKHTCLIEKVDYKSKEVLK